MRSFRAHLTALALSTLLGCSGKASHQQSSPAPDATNAATDIHKTAALLGPAIVLGRNSSFTRIETDLVLPLLGPAGERITWVSSAPHIVSDRGVVKRPAFGQGDAAVTLRATIAKGADEMRTSFSLVVLEETAGLAELPAPAVDLGGALRPVRAGSDMLPPLVPSPVTPATSRTGGSGTRPSVEPGTGASGHPAPVPAPIVSTPVTRDTGSAELPRPTVPPPADGIVPSAEDDLRFEVRLARSGGRLVSELSAPDAVLGSVVVYGHPGATVSVDDADHYDRCVVAATSSPGVPGEFLLKIVSLNNTRSAENSCVRTVRAVSGAHAAEATFTFTRTD